MGVVYRARDCVLQRTVAIKVLPQQNVDPSAPRMLQEAQAASALNHPNVCTIHEIGEADGLPYMVMEVIEGQPLEALIPPGGLPHKTVLDYAVQIVSALSHAHGRGIVHGDLKSSNVMITSDGFAKVLDFGLARRLATGDAPVPVNDPLSRTDGAYIVGTLPYMAPEILHALPAEPRTDIWAMGVLLYEMCTKDLPFRGATQGDTMAAIIGDPPHPMPASVPRSLREVILRCLAKEPSKRYETAAELRRALESAKFLSESVRIRTLQSQEIDSIAVLPFSNAASDPEVDYLCDGVAGTLINSLSRLQRLRVVPRTLTKRYQGKDIDLQAVGRELDVRSVLTGSIQRRGDELLVKAELVDVENIHQLWGDHYQKPLGDLFEVEEEIARRITTSLRLVLTGPEKAQLATRATENPEAYQEFLKGRFYLEKRTASAFKKALDHFRQSIQNDPSYALPYSGLADAFALLGAPEYGVLSPGETMPRARAAAIKALEIDPTVGDAHSALGWVKFRYDWDWQGAIREFDRAIELNPHYANVRFWRAYCLASIERFSEAVAEARRAQAIDPLSLIINAALGWMLYFKGDDERALEIYLGVHEMEPNFMIVHWGIGQLYERQGRYDRAVEEYERSVALSNGNPAQVASLAHAYAMAGRRAQAEQLLANLLALSTSYVSPFKIGLIYAGLGDVDRAFEWLERAYEIRDGWMTTLKVSAELVPLRTDPRYAQLVARVGFPQD
jgi:serine/threonine protein kinase/Flp pilus assembly protein TadD